MRRSLICDDQTGLSQLEERPSGRSAAPASTARGEGGAAGERVLHAARVLRTLIIAARAAPSTPQQRAIAVIVQVEPIVADGHQNLFAFVPQLTPELGRRVLHAVRVELESMGFVDIRLRLLGSETGSGRRVTA